MTSPPSPRAIGAGRPGRVRKATREALEEARALEGWSSALEVRAMLAESYAALVDRAASSGDAPGLLRAGDKLREILDGLTPAVGEVIPSDSHRDPAERLHLVMDSPPTVGDAADA